MSELNVMSFNVRYSSDKGTEAWSLRFVNLVPLVRDANPDLIGFQEVLHNQYLDLIDSFPEYGHVGRGRSDGENEGERSAIFYKKKRFELLDGGDFWISETPDVPSFGWDAHCIRICTYVKLHDIMTKKEFYHFNVHLDHAGKTAMLEGAKLVRKSMLEKNMPSFVTGDFNFNEKTEPYEVMTQGGLYDAKYTAASSMSHGTFHGYKPAEDIADKSPIDYIFHTDGFVVKSYKVLVNGSEGKYTSDHYPVLVKMEQN